MSYIVQVDGVTFSSKLTIPEALNEARKLLEKGIPCHIFPSTAHV